MVLLFAHNNVEQYWEHLSFDIIPCIAVYQKDNLVIYFENL